MTIPGTHNLDRRANKILVEFAATDPEQLLSTSEVAELFGVSVQWLEIGRLKGYGPEPTEMGPRRIRYKRSDLVEWLSERHYHYAERAPFKGGRRKGDRVVDGRVVRAG